VEKRNNIKNFTKDELEKIIVEDGLPRFRANQIYKEIYAHRKSDFEEMAVLPKKIRKSLAKRFEINSLVCLRQQKSTDGTQKFLFKLRDSNSIESVLMPEKQKDAAKQHVTLCISTQAGCSLNCTFCATGKLGFSRNLETAEIIDQILLTEKLTGLKITNIVFMGMGEPLLNFDSVEKAIKIMTETGVNQLIKHSKITCSTVGIVPGIIRLADSGLNIKLAISLHSTNNTIRSKLIPVNAKYSIKKIVEAVEYYYKKTHIPITYEYILFDELNNTEEDIRKLIKITRRVPSKINIIKFHDISFTKSNSAANDLTGASFASINQFIEKLRKAKVNVFLRLSNGIDIDAACGQLALSGRLSLFNHYIIIFIINLLFVF
jgi:23S rRNA (adenine2503-C2)-methyltransferase